jgi:hypothetical protein
MSYPASVTISGKGVPPKKRMSSPGDKDASTEPAIKGKADLRGFYRDFDNDKSAGGASAARAMTPPPRTTSPS